MRTYLRMGLVLSHVHANLAFDIEIPSFGSSFNMAQDLLAHGARDEKPVTALPEPHRRCDEVAS